MIKNSSKKTVSAILAMTLFLSGNILTAFADNNYSTNSVSTNEVTISDYDYTYSNYIADNGSISEIYSSDTVNLSSAELQNGAVLEDYAGKQSVVKFSKANSAAIVKANIKQSGYYCFYLTYAGLTDSEKSIILSLLIDGKSPFFEADSLELSRAYVNSTNNFKTDKVGNQLRPEQIQIEKWQTSPFYQNDGGSCYPYYFYMTAGEHQISISAANGGVAIERIEFKQPKALNKELGVFAIEPVSSGGNEKTESVINNGNTDNNNSLATNQDASSVDSSTDQDVSNIDSSTDQSDSNDGNNKQKVIRKVTIVEGGLTPLAIAGIVAGAVVVVGGIVTVIIILSKKRKKS